MISAGSCLATWRVYVTSSALQSDTLLQTSWVVACLRVAAANSMWSGMKCRVLLYSTLLVGSVSVARRCMEAASVVVEISLPRACPSGRLFARSVVRRTLVDDASYYRFGIGWARAVESVACLLASGHDGRWRTSCWPTSCSVLSVCVSVCQCAYGRDFVR